MKKEQSIESESHHSALCAVSGSFTEKDIHDVASGKYFRRYSGYIDEQIQLDRSRDMEIAAFKEGVKWALENWRFINDKFN